MSFVGTVGEGWVLWCDGGSGRLARAAGCVSVLRDARSRERVVEHGEVDVAGAELWEAARHRGWALARSGESGEVHVCQACAEKNRF